MFLLQQLPPPDACAVCGCEAQLNTRNARTPRITELWYEPSRIISCAPSLTSSTTRDARGTAKQPTVRQPPTVVTCTSHCRGCLWSEKACDRLGEKGMG